MKPTRTLTKTEILKVVIARDGLHCHVGGEKGAAETLHLMTRDGNQASRDPENYFLVCGLIRDFRKSLVRLKKASTDASSYLCVSESAGVIVDDAPHQTSWELLRALKSKPAFLHYLFVRVMMAGTITFKQAMNDGAKAARLSSSTTRRYLDEETSDPGMYMIKEEGGQQVIMFKPQWDAYRLRLEAQKQLEINCLNWRDDLIEAVPGVIRCKKKRPKKDRAPGSDGGPSEPTPPP